MTLLFTLCYGSILAWFYILRSLLLYTIFYFASIFSLWWSIKTGASVALGRGQMTGYFFCDVSCACL
jgi:hypothetical protein